MATRIIQAPVCHVKNKDCDLGFAKTVDFVKIANIKRIKSLRTKFSVVNSSNPGSDIAQLQFASEGSSLLVPRQMYCESPYKTVRGRHVQ
ncbi:4-hydroxy-3-methylbut-2-en-1-yl diphosphate synthase (ferredoxin) chloroplastic [Bienertia sinuspersici]